MTPDEQEALSRRYGEGALIVLPLKSGRLAIFGSDRQLISIQEPTADVLFDDLLRKYSAEGEAAFRERRKRETRVEGPASVEEDSGL